MFSLLFLLVSNLLANPFWIDSPSGLVKLDVTTITTIECDSYYGKFRIAVNGGEKTALFLIGEKASESYFTIKRRLHLKNNHCDQVFERLKSHKLEK